MSNYNNNLRKRTRGGILGNFSSVGQSFPRPSKKCVGPDRKSWVLSSIIIEQIMGERFSLDPVTTGSLQLSPLSPEPPQVTLSSHLLCHSGHPDGQPFKSREEAGWTEKEPGRQRG